MDIRMVLEEYDDFISRRDYERGGEFLSLAREAAEAEGDYYAELTITNELIGHHRKNGNRNECYNAITRTLELIELTGTNRNVSAGTGYINVATGYNRFGDLKLAIDYYRKAECIYEDKLPPHDVRFGGLYNNLATALTALGRYAEARRYYDRAARLMNALGKKEDEAVTYVNLADLEEASGGAADEIKKLLDRAYTLLDECDKRDGYYAFVCEKCAPAFIKFGETDRGEELMRRAAEIYGR